MSSVIGNRNTWLAARAAPLEPLELVLVPLPQAVATSAGITSAKPIRRCFIHISRAVLSPHQIRAAQSGG
jgi:hypothetical protein